MNPINFMIMPLAGLIIGFITNWIAIKFLFYPKRRILGIQGLIPKRKEKIAEKIAESSLYILPNKIEKLTKIPYLGKKILSYIREEVKEKIKSMDNEEIQKIIEQTAKKELRFIEYSGAVLGFILGLIQAAVLELI